MNTGEVPCTQLYIHMAHTVKNAGMKFESHKYIEFLPSFGHPASLKANNVNLQINKHSNVQTFYSFADMSILWSYRMDIYKIAILKRLFLLMPLYNLSVYSVAVFSLVM